MCTMEEKGIFRSALGGFNKSDVLGYIDELTGSWNEERELLEEQARADRESAAQATAKAEELQNALEAAQAELETARPLAEQVETLTAQLAQLRTELDTATAETARLTAELAKSDDKSQSARAEMMAAEDRLQTREAELANRNERIAALEVLVTRYEAVLGQSNGMQQHVDGVVRPFADAAARRAEHTLEDTHAIIASLLAQLGELQDSIVKQQQVLRDEKAENDAALTRVLSSWFNKAKELADSAAGRATHFFR